VRGSERLVTLIRGARERLSNMFEVRLSECFEAERASMKIMTMAWSERP
jgi:hypothetical protein